MSGSPLSDDERAEVARVFEKHQALIKNVARQHARPDDVPDVVQAVGMKLCRYLGDYRGTARFETWLYRIVVNEAIEIYRRDGRLVEKHEAARASLPPEPIVQPEDTLLQADRRAAVRDALRRMQPSRRRIAVDSIACAAVKDYSDARFAKSSRWAAMHEVRVRLANDVRIESPVNGDPAHGSTQTRDDTGRADCESGRSDGALTETGILSGRRRVRSRRPAAGRAGADGPEAVAPGDRSPSVARV